MRRQLLPAVRVFLVLTVLLGIAYPLAVTLVAQLTMSDKADGSLVERDGEVVGSSLIGQAFSDPGFFHPRPSAAGAAASGSPDDAGAAVDAEDRSLWNSGASNLGPTNPDLIATVEERAAAYREEQGLADDTPVPVDAVTASGSGLDPHISVANARLQAVRVAEERGIPVDEVLRLVDEHTSTRSLGFLGEDGVNVLELNLALGEGT